MKLFFLILMLLAQTVTPAELPPVAYIESGFAGPTMVATGLYVQVGEETRQLNNDRLNDGLFLPFSNFATASWSPDCTQLVFAGTDDRYASQHDTIGAKTRPFIYDLQTEQSEPLLDMDGINYPVWSPQSNMIAIFRTSFQERTGQLLFVTSEGEITRTFDFPDASGARMQWTPDARHFYIPTGSNLSQIKLETGVVQSLEIGRNEGFAVSDEYVAFLVRVSDGDFTAIKLTTHNDLLHVQELYQGRGYFYNPTISPDERWLTYNIDADTGFYLYSLEDGSVRHLISSDRASVYGWLDNSTIVFGQSEEDRLGFYTLSLNDESITQLGSIPGFTSALYQEPCLNRNN